MTSAVQHIQHTGHTRHPMPRRLTAWIAALAVMLAPLVVHQAWAQDALAEARQHYAAGKGLFDAGDYRAAIREFETANRLAPSPILLFNIGLAHERLGEKAEALQRYRDYLQAMPTAPNRGTVQAKIQRLEAELGAARTAQEPTGGEPALAPGGTQGEAAVGEPSTDPLAGVRAGNPLDRRETQPGTTPGAGESATGGQAVHGGVPAPGSPEPGDPASGGQATAAPQPSAPAATGDPMLDRVAAIDVAAIRDQRAHLLGPPDAAAAGAGAAGGGDTGEGESEPVYKQVWFWVVVGVSAVILLDIASSDSSDTATTRAGQPLLRF